MRGFAVPLAATLAAQIVGALAHLTLPVLATQAALAYGLPPGLVGVHAGILFLGSAVSSLVLAGRVPGWGAIRVSQVGLACCALGVATIPLGIAWLLPIGAVLIGFGYGPLTPASSHILARTAPPRFMALIFSIKQTGVPAGYALAGAMLPVLAVAFDWRVATWVVVAICAGLALLLQVVRPSLDADRGSARPFAVASILEPLSLVRNVPGLRRMAIASLSFSAIQIGVAAFLVVYLDETVGLDLQRAGLVLSAANIAAIGGRVLWGALADRLVSARALLAGLGFGMAGGLTVLLFASPLWPYAAIVVIGIVLGATVISWNGVFLAETARQAPAGRISEATGGVLSITYLGAVAGPPALTLLVTMSGSYHVGFGLLAALAVAVAVMFVRSPPAAKAPLEPRA